MKKDIRVYIEDIEERKYDKAKNSGYIGVGFGLAGDGGRIEIIEGFWRLFRGEDFNKLLL